LKEILPKYFHCKKCCNVLEVDINRVDGLLMNVSKKKPIDYFALRDKSGNWIFCFRTIYDNSFDAAIFEIFHAQIAESRKPEWEDVKQKLNALFLINETPNAEGIREANGIKIYSVDKIPNIN
jgi:hypothetical protein